MKQEKWVVFYITSKAIFWLKDPRSMTFSAEYAHGHRYFSYVDADSQRIELVRKLAQNPIARLMGIASTEALAELV